MDNIHTLYARVEAAKRALSISNKLADPSHRSRAFSLLNKHRAILKRAQSGKKALRRHLVDFYSTVAGIPCGILVCPIDGELSIVDKNGYDAPWLESKSTHEDYDRFQRELDEINKGFALNDAIEREEDKLSMRGHAL